MEKKEKIYYINETIPKQDGTKVYCINKRVDEINGYPIVEEVFKGTLEECKKEIKKLEMR